MIDDHPLHPLAVQLAIEEGCHTENRNVGERLDQLGVREDARVGFRARSVEDDAHRLETETPRDEHGESRMVDRPEPRSRDDE